MPPSPEQTDISITAYAHLKGFPIARAMAAIYALLGIIYILFPPVSPGWLYAILAFLTAAGLGVIGLSFKIIPDYLVHPFYFLGSLCGIAFALAFLVVSNDPEQTIILIIIILGASSVFMSIWLSPAMLLCAITGWCFIAYDFPHPRFIHWLTNISFTSLLGFVITWQRVRMMRKIELEKSNVKEAHKSVLRQSLMLRQQSKKLVAARDQAMESSKAKSDFLANISHEIRTPMNAVLVYTNILLESGLNDDQYKHTQTIHTSAYNLMTIINSILDFSEIEKKRLDFEVIDFDLMGVMNKINRQTRLAANKKGLVYECEIADDVPCRLSGDPSRLRQVLANLTNNAVKFTSKGKISVHVSLESKNTGKVTLRFSVMDTGIGILKKNLDMLFDPFTQADTSTTRRYGGTGLGLSISKRIVEMMGGEIKVESKEGKGSAFKFTAAFTVPETSSTCVTDPPPPALSLPFEKRKEVSILVVEDNEINQEVVLSILEKLGFTADAVANGVEAVSSLEATKFDIVLMDVQMPEMDGYEATRIIRSPDSRVLDHMIPIIALTANAMKGDREKCIASGMDDYLSKPVDPYYLLEKIEKLYLRDAV